ncbi:MAG: TonB-dependent receptor [Gemmatimonadaceae bacterium]
MMRTAANVFWLCVTAAAALPAQTPPEARLTGQVTARGSSNGVALVTVSLEGTPRATSTDSTGHWTLVNVPSGSQILVTRRLGYAPSRTPITVPTTGALTVNIVLATNELQLDRLIVTADRSARARGELGTASVIDRDAIANQIASSLQGVLELVPGVQLQPPGIDSKAQFSLRSLGTNTSSAGFGGSSSGDIGSAGTLIVLDGVPLSNNANLQSVGSRGETVSPASTAGGGVDLRRIPASTLERVEVISGIPSARWGDLTQGAIVVDTRAAATAPELAARVDPVTREGNIVGGRAYSDDHQAITLTANLAQSQQPVTLSNATTLRAAAQFAHRLRLGLAPGNRVGPDGRTPLARYTFDTRVDWSRLKFDAPAREDIEANRNSFTDDRDLRVGERARLALGSGTVELTAAYDAQSQLTRETQTRLRPATPFTDRLTEGRTVGSFLDGPYLGAYELDGAPHLIYSRLEWDRQPLSQNGRWSITETRVGTELRREWNSGQGYLFDIAKPPQQSSFNGTRGFDRPRTFDGIPPLVTTGVYADLRARVNFAGMVAEVQPGVRADLLNNGDWWWSGSRSSSLEPRLVVQLSPRPWFRLRAGAGEVGKLPTVEQLSPALQYFDLVNVNRYTINPAERLAVLTTFIRDPTNKDLGISRNVKREAGFEIDGGDRRGAITFTYFNDALHNAITIRRDPGTLQRDRYALIDTAQGTGHPGRIVDPPIGSNPVPYFLDRYVNGGELRDYGAEFTVNFPFIPRLRTRLELSGATIHTSFATSDRDYGNVAQLQTFQVDTTIKRVAFFDGASRNASQSLITWRLVHHQPSLGLVITAVIQQRLTSTRATTSRTDSLSFVGYLTRTGESVLVPEDQRTLPQYGDLRAARASASASATTQPRDLLMSLQVAKSIGASGRLSFYVFNAFDKIVTFGADGGRSVLSPTRFGAELTIPTATFFGGGR